MTETLGVYYKVSSLIYNLYKDLKLGRSVQIGHLYPKS